MPGTFGTRKFIATAAACAAVLALSVPASGSASLQSGSSGPAGPVADYWVYVAAESADLLHRVRFGPGGLIVEKTIPVGLAATETEGPHGLAISQDGRYLHMSTGHGFPDGMYWKIELGPDTVVGEPVPLGMFPATLDVTPDGLYAFVVNFNLFGDMVPSSVSVIYTPDNMEVARTTTCTMPHGSRLDPSGLFQYSGCMMDDQLVELDTRSFEVSRRFSLAAGNEGPIEAAAGHEGHMTHETGAPMRMTPSCSPTWAQPSVDGRFVYVACNKSDQILEIDRDGWNVARRFATGRAPYNLAASPDGKLLISTLKAGAAVEFFDLETGRSLARTPTSIRVVHGVVISPDSRYAFVSVEGIGAEPGKVDVFDLRTFERVGSVDVGQQAGGIAFWKMEPR